MATTSQRIMLFGGGILTGLASYILLQKSTKKSQDYSKEASYTPAITPKENEDLLLYGFPGPNSPNRKHSKFKEDENIPSKFNAKLKDYYKSGYDRGHMAPAADAKRSQKAMDETFYLSNMCPQVGPGFNQNYWAYLESFTRDLVDQFQEVYIITGPLYLPKKEGDKWIVQYEVIGNPPNVAVPTHFYKIILGVSNNNPEALGGFLLPNKSIPNETPLSEFVAPLAFIERAAGLEFFDKLGENKEIIVPKLCDKVQCQLANYIKEYPNNRK